MRAEVLKAAATGVAATGAWAWVVPLERVLLARVKTIMVAGIVVATSAATRGAAVAVAWAPVTREAAVAGTLLLFGWCHP